MLVQRLFKSALLASLVAMPMGSSLRAQTPSHGVAYQKPGETPHAIKVEIPPNAPSISSDFGSGWGGWGKGDRRKMTVVGPRGFERRSSVWHNGIDIPGPEGSPVIAAADGYVFQVGDESGSGPFVNVVHGDNVNANGLASSYIHLLRITVSFGQFVRRGEKIGEMGWIGPWSKSSHLHFTVFRRNIGMVQSPLNPHEYWIGSPGKIECFDARKQYPPAEAKFTYPVPCKGQPYLKAGKR